MTKGGHPMLYIVIAIVAVFLIYMFFKYKKYNRNADRFEDVYPDANSKNQKK